MAAPPAPVRKPRRWLRRFVVLLLLLGVAAWFAPAVAALTGAPQRILKDATAELKGTLDVGHVGLSWFAPIELRDVVVKDAQGRVLLKAPKITSSKNLFAFLTDRADLGTFTLEQPIAEVHFENGTTNLESAIANYLKDDAPPKPARPAVTINMNGGTLVLHEGGRQSKLESVDASVGIPASRDEAIRVALRSGNQLDAALSLGEKSSAKLTATAFALDSLAPAMNRLDPGFAVAGALTAKLDATWSKDAATVEGAASVKDLDLAGRWLKGDHLKLASAELPINLAITGKHVKLDRAEFRCDAGTLSASGSFDAGHELDKLFDQPGVTVEGDFDLAKVAAILPKLLRIREGTAIREGRLTLKIASKPGTEGTTWDGDVRTSALKAERAGKLIEWKEPLTLEFSGRVPAGRMPTFDKFVCRSDFIAINAKGSPENVRAAANVYLDRLAARLGEFVDLRGITLDGEGSATLIASRTPQGDLKADAGLELKQFTFSDGGSHGIHEPQLSLKASLSGSWPHGGAVRLEAGTLTITAGSDSAELKLLEAVPDARKPEGGTLSANVKGELGRWMNRVRGFVRIPNYTFGGQTVATGTVRFSKPHTSIEKLTVGIDRAVFRGAGLNLDEPRLDASADLSITSAGVDFANFRIASAVLSVTDGKLLIETPSDGNTAVGGGGNAVTDLTRLSRTLKISTDPKGTDSLHGRGTGPIRFRWQGDTTTFGGTLDVTNFAYGDPKQTGISESQLKLDLDAKYENSAETLTIFRGNLERSGLALDAKGAMAKLFTTQDVNFGGTLAYDLAKLSPDLRNSLGGGFQASGKGTRSFALAGSLGGNQPNVFAKLTAEAGVGWDAVKAYGFEMGPGEFTVKLANGKADISPIRATFGEGKIALSPMARFDPEPAEAFFAKGIVVERAKLTPAVTAGALGYALPAIANAAQANGEISAILDDNRIPLADMSKSSVKGRLVIHKATIGPGPVITEILKATGSTNTVMTLANESTTSIRVENGRVHHENFAVTVNNYTIRTSGSAGFDGSLSMIADVPIPGTLGLLKNNPVLKKSLEGKIVKVPLTGTIAKPVLDPNVFAAAVSGLARDAMKGVGKELLNRELEKLFPLKKP
ncbi:MAG: hypothetical protein U0791_14200 [Gemmataceae bacterium]